MGYRHYFELVEKLHIEKLSEMSAEDIKSSFAGADGHIELDVVLSSEMIFEFGQLHWDGVAEQIQSKGVSLFSIDVQQELFPDNEITVVGKDGVLEAIDIYSRKIEKYFLNLLEDDINIDTEWAKAHPKIIRLCEWLHKYLKVPMYVPKQVTSYKDKCVQAVQEKLNWISPYYRTRMFKEMADIEVIDDLSEKLDEIEVQPVNIVNLDTSYHNRFQMADNWLYEYEVFSLCCILKHVDWDKYTILFVGR